MTATSPIKNHQLKVALVYDRINIAYGGAEQVLLILHKLFPNAPIYTSVYNRHQSPWAEDLKIIPSFLQTWPGATSYHRCYVPLMPLAFESLDLSDYELIVSVTSAEAKGVITKPEQIHLSYLLSPSRYLYSHKKQYLKSRSILTKPGVNWLSRHLLEYLKWWDQAAIHRPDFIIPLSRKIQQRIKTYYDLETLEPIYPPIDAINLNTNLDSLKDLDLPSEYYLVVSRLVPYKNIDIAIKACQRLNHHLVIVGTGPHLNKLKKIAGKDSHHLIHFLSEQAQTTVNTLMQQAKLFLSPAEDDFGLAPLQANLFGTPVIIYQQSGVAEVFKNRLQGTIMPEATTESLVNSISHTSSLEFDPDKMKQAATQFDQTRFLFNFKNVVKTIVANKLGKKL